ncbi:hypothetical protein FDECE_13683 [Fusarium decemcellulare]|nr:hypothetical protein FDECE_13683 [Fusarium decemcellulare]
MTSTEYPDDKREELGGSSGCVHAEMGEEAVEPLSEAEMSAQKRLVRKLDLTLMPMVFILYMFNYLDRNTIAKELALRYALLYSGLILATAISGLLAAGIFAGLSGVAGLAGWRWLFIIEGAISFALGLIAIVVLPDFPSSKSQGWLFTEKEREIAISRMARDAVSSQVESKVWIFALILCSNQSAYGFNYFYPAIVKGFNLGNRTITLVCTAPPYLLGAVCACFIAWSSDRRAERGFHIIGPVLTAVVGFIITLSVLNVPARYVASFLYVCGCFSAIALLYSWSVSSLNQTPEKKACATALINIIGQLGSIWSPYFFDPNDEPRYTRAMILLMAFAILEVCLCLLMKFILKRQNKQILAEFAGTGRTPNLYTL